MVSRWMQITEMDSGPGADIACTESRARMFDPPAVVSNPKFCIDSSVGILLLIPHFSVHSVAPAHHGGDMHHCYFGDKGAGQTVVRDGCR